MPLTSSELAVVSRLLDEALALDATDRVRWLDTLPSEFGPLAPVLRQLLSPSMSVKGHSVLDHLPRLREAEPSTMQATADELVGPYRLLREIGAGGMGAVWLAERADGAFKRQVALKLPRLAWAPGLAERLRRERDILAVLEHPNIARLYDAGVDAHGRPYFALEYVEGEPIDTHCRLHALSLRDRLQIFLQVARAVAYAHTRLIVHRDLKPSNILVAVDGTVRLLDFGIAKLVAEDAPEASQLTAIWGRALTPHYASPEQLQGGLITVASDVYALGVVLYELLAGCRPYALERGSPAAPESANPVRDPPLASQRVSDPATRRALRGDLDTILAKALKHDAAARYATVEAFAADLERYLNGQPVLARPDSARYRLGKFVARHKLGLGASAVTLLAVVAGAGAALWQAEQARAEAERARLVRDFVIEVFGGGDRDNQSGAALLQLPAELLIERNARQIDERFKGQPQLQAELFGAIGAVFLGLGHLGNAEAFARKHLAAIEYGGGTPLERARAMELVARAQVQADRFEEAEAMLHRALEVLGTGHAEFEARLRASLARALSLHGKVALAGAELDIVDGILSRNDLNESRAAAEAVFARARLLSYQDRVAEALPLYERAVGIAIRREGATSELAIQMRDAYANALFYDRRPDECVRVYDALVADIRQLGGELGVYAAEVELGITRTMLLVELIDGAEAMARIERIKRRLEEQRGRAPRRLLALVDFSLGLALYSTGQVVRANELIVDAAGYLLGVTRDVRLEDTVRQWLAESLREIGKHDEAARLLDELVDKLRKDFGPTHWVTAEFAGLAAEVLIMKGDYDGAQQRLQLAATSTTGFDREGFEFWIRSVNAWLLVERGRYEEAISVLTDTLTAEKGRAGPAREQGKPKLRPTYPWEQQVHARAYARALCSGGQPQQGAAVLEKFIASRVARNHPASPWLAADRAHLGLCLLKLGERKRAAELASLARKAFEEQPQVSPYYKAPWLELERRLKDVRRAAAGRLSRAATPRD